MVIIMLISNVIALLAAVAIERPLFSLDQQTLVNIGIQLINVCILAVALRFLLYKPVRRFMQRRTREIMNQMSTAEERQIEADGLKALYEQKLLDLEHERYEILDSAKAQAETMSEKMIDETKDEIAAMRSLAKADITKEHERIEEEMKQYIIDVASLMAGKFVAHSIDEYTQNKLFEESLSELEIAL